MVKNQVKLTSKQKGYSILIALVATCLTVILSLLSIGQLANIFSASSVGFFLLPLCVVGFVIIVVIIAATRYKRDLYLRLGTYLCILFLAVIIFFFIGVGMQMGTIT